jgi:hypothetical protein
VEPLTPREPELARAAVHSIKVRGTLRASAEVKAALRERMATAV